MSTVSCDFNTLNKGYPCVTCLSEIERQAALVYLLSRRQASLQGVAVQTPNQLRAATACLTCSRPALVIDDMDVFVAKVGAINGGASDINTQTIAQLKKASLAFRNMSMTELRAIEIVLRCQLNAFP